MRPSNVRTKDEGRGAGDDQQASGKRRELAGELVSRLHWPVLQPLASALGGDERSKVRGFGAEMSEIREYQPGDDVRHIDWNSTARADRPYVREAHVERALDVWLLMDVSASVDWGTAECLKRDRAIEFAAVVGQLLSRHGNRVGALLFADRPLSFIAPGAGRHHVQRMLATIQNEPRQNAQRSTDLRSALLQAGAVIRRRSLVLVVSDFLAPDGWQSAMGQLAQRHEVVAVRLRDPRESELPDVGVITLEDPESGSQLVADTGDAALRQRFQQAARAQDEAIGAAVAGHGIDLLVLNTDDALLPTLVNFLHLRRRRRTLAAAHGAIRRNR